MPSSDSFAAQSAAAGARTLVSMPSRCSALARRRMNDPGVSSEWRGKLCVRKRTFMLSSCRLVRGNLVELAANLAELRAFAGDLLAEEPRREENASQHEARLNDCPDRSNTKSDGEVHAQGDEAGERAKCEEPCPEHAEKEQRFLAE